MKALLRCLLSLLMLTSYGCAAQPREEVPLFSQAELDQMLAPVALYPDQLLSQVLMAATYPLEVVQAARWSREHPGLQGQEAVRAVDDKAWDPSVKSLVAFPDLLAQMDADLDWTERLGDAFLAQQQQVMDTVQSLRQRAYDAGNLRSGEHVQVVREREVIYVRSAYPDVIYVPYYDPFTIYGSWWWPHYRPVYWAPWPSYGVTLGYGSHGGFYWGSGFSLGAGFFFSDWDWHDHHVRVVDYHALLLPPAAVRAARLGARLPATAAGCRTGTARSRRATCPWTGARYAATTTAMSATAIATTDTAVTTTATAIAAPTPGQERRPRAQPRAGPQPRSQYRHTCGRRVPRPQRNAAWRRP